MYITRIISRLINEVIMRLINNAITRRIYCTVRGLIICKLQIALECVFNKKRHTKVHGNNINHTKRCVNAKLSNIIGRLREQLTKPKNPENQATDMTTRWRRKLDREAADASWETAKGKKLQERVKKLFNTPDENGLTLSDRGILRSNTPISEKYGPNDWKPDDFEDFEAVKYIPGEGFVSDKNE